VKRYASGRRSIFGLRLVMLTGLCGYLYAGRPDGGSNTHLQPVEADGPINLPLDQELKLHRRIFLGACQVVCDELGMVPQRGKEVGSGMDREVFRVRSASLEKDPDMKGEIRMMVPVFYDVKRKQMRV